MGLRHLVYYQIEHLKRLRDEWFATPSVKLSIDAALQAYRAGDLDAVPGLVSYWWNGHMVRGPAPESQAVDLPPAVGEWGTLYGKGQVHIERVVIHRPIQYASVAIYPPDPQPQDPVAVPNVSFHHVSRPTHSFRYVFSVRLTKSRWRWK